VVFFDSSRPFFCIPTALGNDPSLAPPCFPIPVPSVFILGFFPNPLNTLTSNRGSWRVFFPLPVPLFVFCSPSGSGTWVFSFYFFFYPHLSVVRLESFVCPSLSRLMFEVLFPPNWGSVHSLIGFLFFFLYFPFPVWFLALDVDHPAS